MTGSHFYIRGERGGVCVPLHECRCGECRDCACLCPTRMGARANAFVSSYVLPNHAANPVEFKYVDMESKKTHRRYLPTLSELIDRLSIVQLKDVFITEHKAEYAQEIKDIMHDIDMCLEENDGQLQLNSELVRNIIVLAQMNLHIWHNESNWRKGIREGNNLELTHGLNGIRNTAKNKIQSEMGGRKDYKVDNVEAFKEWVPSGWEEE